MLARIIDPAAGASTCALGSHKWVKYMGILIRNANVNVNLRKIDGHAMLGGMKNIIVFVFW